MPTPPTPSCSSGPAPALSEPGVRRDRPCRSRATWLAALGRASRDQDGAADERLRPPAAPICNGDGDAADAVTRAARRSARRRGRRAPSGARTPTWTNVGAGGATRLAIGGQRRRVPHARRRRRASALNGDVRCRRPRAAALYAATRAAARRRHHAGAREDFVARRRRLPRRAAPMQLRRVPHAARRRKATSA